MKKSSHKVLKKKNKMTVARFNARGRTRLLLFLGVTLCGLIFVIVFHNNQQENDELRQLELRCQQQLGGEFVTFMSSRMLTLMAYFSNNFIVL